MNTVYELSKNNGVFLAAHRGSCGGNIPCNTLQSFEIAVRQGADIVELDVERSADNKLFIQHPGMEWVHIGCEKSIKEYPASEVEGFVRLNADMNPTAWKMIRLEDALELLRGRCIVNIDKFWENPKLIADTVRNMGMTDQVIIKSPDKPEYIDAVERYAPEIPYIPVVSDFDRTHMELMSRNLNYVGVEALFTSEKSETASPEYIERLHKDRKFVWANSLVYYYKSILSAGHDDDVSLTDDPAKGWGWLASRGYDVIQTDHILACRLYLESIGKRIMH